MSIFSDYLFAAFAALTATYCGPVHTSMRRWILKRIFTSLPHIITKFNMFLLPAAIFEFVAKLRERCFPMNFPSGSFSNWADRIYDYARIWRTRNLDCDRRCACILCARIISSLVDNHTMSAVLNLLCTVSRWTDAATFGLSSCVCVFNKWEMRRDSSCLFYGRISLQWSWLMNRHRQPNRRRTTCSHCLRPSPITFVRFACVTFVVRSHSLVIIVIIYLFEQKECVLAQPNSPPSTHTHAFSRFVIPPTVA